jgi:hypothetical protein
MANNKRSASLAELDDDDRERGAQRQCLKHVHSTGKRKRGAECDENSTDEDVEEDGGERYKARQRKTRVITNVRCPARPNNGLWLLMEQAEWDALMAVFEVASLVKLHTTALPEAFFASKADFRYRPSEETSPVCFSNALRFVEKRPNLAPARIRGFSVALSAGYQGE